MKNLGLSNWAWLVLLLIMLNAAGYLLLTTYWSIDSGPA